MPCLAIAYFVRDMQPLLTLTLVASSLFWLALVTYHRSLQRYEIAPGPIVRQHVGFVSRAARRIPVSGQLTVEYAQSAWGRIFNFGNVKIYSDMNASLDWVGVVSPRKVVAYIEDIRLSPDNFSI